MRTCVDTVDARSHRGSNDIDVDEPRRPVLDGPGQSQPGQDGPSRPNPDLTGLIGFKGSNDIDIEVCEPCRLVLDNLRLS